MDAQRLKQFIADNPPAAEFQPYYYFSKEADSITFYFRDEADYSKRLSDHVTLMLSCESNEIVGCRIKGVSGIIEDLPNYIAARHENVALSIVFLPFRSELASETDRELLNQVAREARKLPLEPVG